jgi:hypothetical protein
MPQRGWNKQQIDAATEMIWPNKVTTTAEWIEEVEERNGKWGLSTDGGNYDAVVEKSRAET